MSDKYRSLEDIIRDMMMGRIPLKDPTNSITNMDADPEQSITVDDQKSANASQQRMSRSHAAQYKKKIIDAT